MSDINLECYAGFKGEQYPQRFTLRERVLEAEEVEDQWYSPPFCQLFRVRTVDGNI